LTALSVAAAFLPSGFLINLEPIRESNTMLQQTAFASDSPRVLIIEDEPDLREAIVAYLSTEAIATYSAGSLAEAQVVCETGAFDVLILDLGLPDGDGMQWLEHSNLVAEKGVLILSARGSPAQRLAGLRAGADAYLVKPVALDELIQQVKNLFARIRALTPGAGQSPPMLSDDPIQRDSDAPRWQLHAQTWVLSAPNGRTLVLKHAEKLLLQTLMRPAGEVIGKEQIILSQGGKPDSYDYRRVETLVRRLRARCLSVLGIALPVQTIYGRGLAFTEPCSVVHQPPKAL
jgi:DNA-binding response OmpR family regulator